METITLTYEHRPAIAEHTTYRVVNRQVARAKRLLRQLDEHYRDT